MNINTIITIALFVLLITIVNIQIKTFKKLQSVELILQENLLPPLPEWEEQIN